MAYIGNLTCRDCGLTFTARWGSMPGADEYRCDNDHVVHVDPESGVLLGTVDGVQPDLTLADFRGLCPRCSTELATGRLPCCPVCASRDHDVAVGGVLS